MNILRLSASRESLHRAHEGVKSLSLLTSVCHVLFRVLGKKRGHIGFQLNSEKLILHIGKGIPVAGHGGPYGCETSKLPHYLDNRLTDGGEVVSLTCRPPFTPQEDSWYSFLLEAKST
jgi:hypothetical protein